MALGAAITSRANARVKALRASFSGKAARPGELVGLEGEHLIEEALRSGFALETMYVREGSESVLERASLAVLDQDAMVVLSAEVFASAVDTGSPQGVAATLRIPQLGARPSPERRGPSLLLESLQDPGNVGTLIRSAEAFDAMFVWTTDDCANIWSPKVVRASAGSVFRVPTARETLKSHGAALQEMGCKLIAAVAPRPGARSLFEMHLDENCVVMIGNEGAGLSAEALAMADALVTVPCGVESLNAAVAGSTILYEAMRQRYVRRALP